jgi:hypothetical protein
MAALYEKVAENYGEEDALIIWIRCQKNLEKRREMSCNEVSKEGAKWSWEKTPRPVFKIASLPAMAFGSWPPPHSPP